MKGTIKKFEDKLTGGPSWGRRSRWQNPQESHLGAYISLSSSRDTSRSFVISQNLEPAVVSVWCSCSCSEYIILVLHRGRPRPSKGPATKTTYIFSTQFQTLKGKRDPRPGPASIIPSTNTLLSRALARQREIRAQQLPGCV